jgi:hypothetical protein
MAIGGKCLPKSLTSHRADRRVAGVKDRSVRWRRGAGERQAGFPPREANRTFKPFGDDLKARRVQMPNFLTETEQRLTAEIVKQTNGRPEIRKDQGILQ